MGAGALYSMTVPGKSAPPAAWEGDTLYPLIVILEGRGKGLYTGWPASKVYATPAATSACRTSSIVVEQENAG